MKRILKKAVSQSFGEVHVYLFGSRVDDDLNGGDIDLAVDVKMDQEQF
ncbi:nucleotidyltransferase domain-containing protein [Cysteiniphilum halobium]